MGTKDFNALDLIICRWRLGEVRKHIAAGDEVLDFGCGHQALFLRSVQKRISQGVGIDYDATPGRPSENIEIKQYHFKDRLEFSDASFNKIVILAVIEHIPFDLRTPLLAEFHRVLKDGGEVIITTPTPAAQPVLEFLAFKLKIISQPEIADHKHYYSKPDLDSLAAQHGFDCVSYRTFQFGMNSISVFAKHSPSRNKSVQMREP